MRRFGERTPAAATAAQPAQLAASLGSHLVVLVATALGAYWVMFSQFAVYDDEGYHVFALKLFASGHPLYDSVFSYYGPFPYEWWGGLSALTGITFSTNTGRLATWVMWLVLTVMLAAITRRITGRLTLALIVQVLSFAVLMPFQNEPMYPGDTALVLTTGLLAMAVFGLRAGPRVALTAIGALVGAVVLTKINAGAYAAIAVGYAAALSLPSLPWQRILRPASIVAIVLIGPAVMTPSLTAGWAQKYAFLVAASALALVLVSARPDTPGEAAAGEGQGWIAWMLGGLGGALTLIIGVILALGTTPRALFDSVLVTASHQARALTVALPLTGGVYAWGIAGPVAAWIARRPPSRLSSPTRSGAVLRMVAGLVIWSSVVGQQPLNIGPENAEFALALPLAWVAALPSTRADGSLAGRFVRRLLPALAVMESLIAYPVAGSQLASASVLFLLCGAVCIADGWSDLQATARDQPLHRRQPAPLAIMTAVTAGLAVLFAIQYVVRPIRARRTLYNSEQPLPFAGATRLRLPAQEVSRYTNIVNTLRVHCRSVITLPGMLSLNHWSDLPAPSGMTQTPWWAVLSPEQLRIALDDASGATGLCLVRNDAVAQLWLGPGHQLPQIPLVRFLEHNFRQAARYGPYVISVRTGAPHRQAP